MSLSRTQIVNWLTRCGDIFSTESEYLTGLDREIGDAGNDSNLLIVFYVQIMPDDFVMLLHRF